MTSVLLDLAIRSSVVLAAGLLIAAALRWRTAAVRHAVLAGAMLGAVTIAPIQFVLPPLRVPLPSPSRAAPPTVDRSAALVRDTGAAPFAIAGGRAPQPAAPVEERPPVLAIAWAAGVAVAMASLIAALVRLRQIARRATPVTEGPWSRLAQEVAQEYGLSREVVLLQTDCEGLLATCGVWRPRVLLPAAASGWPHDRIRVVLCHELAHVRRNDWCVQIAAEAIKAILWFNPLAWLACARLRRESERACDDAVLRRGVAARDYAGHLLHLARMCRASTLLGPSATPMSHSALEGRIAAMLNARLDRRPLSRRGAAAIAALLLAIALPTAALRAGQNPPTDLAGAVYDTTGGVLPGVEFTLRDASQMMSRVMSDASGRFTFGKVPPGHYVLTASLAGFRSFEQEFDLTSNARDWDRAITLQVGTLQETITVQETRMAPVAQGSRPRASEPVRIGGNIRAPRKLVDVRPVYPPAMRAAGREGVVPLEAVIGQDGTVSAVRVLSADIHPDFAIAAADAVRQWRFSPTLLNGAPVEVLMTVSVTFNLSN